MTPPPIFPLPAELSSLILSFLPVADLKEFSTCSKSTRGLCSPLLFQRLKACVDAIPAFQDGGALVWLRDSVRFVDISFEKDTSVQPLTTLCYTYVTHFLPLFPKLTALRIAVYCARTFHYKLFLAMFKSLSERCEFWKPGGSLRSLKLQFVENTTTQDQFSVPGGNYELVHDLLEGGDKEFIGSAFGPAGDYAASGRGRTWDPRGFVGFQGEIGRAREAGWFPMGVEELFITIDLFSFRGETVKWAPTVPEILMRELAGKGRLRRLEVCSDRVVTPKKTRLLESYLSLKEGGNRQDGEGGEKNGSKRVMYEKVKSVRFDTAQLMKRHIKDIAVRFPNLEWIGLSVWSGYFTNLPKYEGGKTGRREVIYRDIMRMKRLRKVYLPWPRATSLTLERDVVRGHLTESVEWWVKKGGMAQLEEVEFTKKIYGAREEFFKCTIIRNGKDGEPEFDWLNGERPLGDVFRDRPAMWIFYDLQLWTPESGDRPRDVPDSGDEFSEDMIEGCDTEYSSGGWSDKGDSWTDSEVE
ncbi:hypothetical protein H072_7879 [Dactylellina haptotyla CBS 200.50]|uniref:F-box domain-containing protein n=1 Tax=Dactylellina haptotyla (strain CBS 200.50) TaxID=1284197 RepID=S8ABB9_DACHA|nr:hypothetical protein H072_7879 [Dactylellina haptotyla CBS 200.50]